MQLPTAYSGAPLPASTLSVVLMYIMVCLLSESRKRCRVRIRTIIFDMAIVFIKKIYCAKLDRDRNVVEDNYRKP